MNTFNKLISRMKKEFHNENITEAIEYLNEVDKFAIEYLKWSISTDLIQSINNNIVELLDNEVTYDKNRNLFKWFHNHLNDKMENHKRNRL